MDHRLPQPRMTETGVVFTIKTDSRMRECLISREALERLSAIKNIDASDAEPLDVFHAFEVTIDNMARRLAAQHARDPLLVLRTDCFDNSGALKQARA